MPEIAIDIQRLSQESVKNVNFLFETINSSSSAQDVNTIHKVHESSTSAINDTVAIATTSTASIGEAD